MAAANAVLCIRRRKKLAQEQAAPTERSRVSSGNTLGAMCQSIKMC